MKCRARISVLVALAIAAAACSEGTTSPDPFRTSPEAASRAGTYRGQYPLGDIALHVYSTPSLWASISGDVMLKLKPTEEVAIYAWDAFGNTGTFWIRENAPDVHFEIQQINQSTITIRWDDQRGGKSAKFFGGPTEVILTK